MRYLFLATTAVAGVLSAPARAADPAIEEVIVADSINLDAVIITASRLRSGLAEVTGAHVINEAELEARQTPFIEDVLATIPGVGVTRTGGFGGLAAIRIRGAGPDKTLVLIDGVPQNDAADPNGTYDPSSLLTDNIARVEVLSGPQGSLWGSDAIGGVVALTTRELSGWRAQAEVGSFGAVRGSLGAGVAQDAYALSASLAGLSAEGISKAASGQEKDGFRSLTGDIGGRVQVSDKVQLDGRVRYTDSKIDIDGFAPPSFNLGDTPDRNTSKVWSGFVRAAFDGFGLKHQLSFSDYDIKRDNLSSFPSHFTAQRQIWRWTAERDGVVLGAERNATEANLSGRPSTDLSTTSVFGVARNQVTSFLTLTGSLRWDDPDRFKARVTGRLAAAASLGHGFTLTASGGQGFKVPTISQVICDFCSPAAARAPLRPEKAEGYDLRLGWTSDDGRVSGALTGYRLSVRDQISYVASRYINIARTRSAGLEAELNVRLTDQTRLKLGYGLLDAVDETTHASLIRNPDHSGSAGLFWEQGAWGAALTVRGESSQTDTATDGFSKAVRPGFVTADLAGSYRLNDHVTLTGRLENLADKRYQESFGYGEPGRAVYVGVRLKN